MVSERTLRSLNEPRPIRVAVDPGGRPVCVWTAADPTRPRAVRAVQDRWRLDDEWWRERTIARLYHSLLLEDGSLLVVYHDLLADAWYAQRA